MTARNSGASSGLFSYSFIRMFAANALLASGFYMIMPLLSVYAVNDLRIEKGSVGFIIGVFAISSVIVRPFAGALLDGVGRMKIYLPALAVFSVCFTFYAFASTVVLLLAVRIFHGAAWGFVNTASSTVVSDIVPSDKRGEGMGYFGLSMTLAMALGPFAGAYLMKSVSFSNIFFICAALSLSALAVSATVRTPYAPRRKFESVDFRSLLEKRVAGIAAVQFLFALTYSGIMSYSVLHGIEAGAGDGVAWFFLVLAFFVSVFRPFAGTFVDRHGPTAVLLSGFAFLSCGLVLLAVSSGIFGYLAAASVSGVGVGFIMPTLIAMAINVVIPSRRGAANATLFTAFDIGMGAGAILLGAVSGVAGYPGMYFLSAVFLIAPTALYLFRVKDEYKRMCDEINKN